MSITNIEWSSKLADINATGKILIAKDKNADGAKLFCTIPDYQFLENYIEQTPESERCFYEVVQAERPVKLYIDMEEVREPLNDYKKNEFINEIIKLCTAGIEKIYGVTDITEADYAIMDSSNEQKTSIHIVLCRKVCFENHVALKKFMEKIMKFAEHIHDIDFSVYRKNGAWRIPGCTKYNQNRHLITMTDHSFEETLVTCCASCDQILQAPKVRKPKTEIADEAIASSQHTDDETYMKLIELIPADYAAEYENWINVGIMLRTAGASEEIWHEFSKKCQEKYNERNAHLKWNTFPRAGYFVGLYNFVRKLDPEKFSEIMSHSVEHIGTYPHEIARALARLYGDNHVFCKDEWWYFNGIKWIRDYSKTHLSRKIMYNFQSDLDKVIRKYREILKKTRSDATVNAIKAQLEVYKAVKLKTSSGRVEKDWQTLNVAFEHSAFDELLDANPDILAFENGVYELETGIFRDTKQDDYITKSVGYNYEPIDAKQRALMDELMELLRKIFPDDQLLEYVLRFVSSNLSGRVREELIHFFTGISTKQTGANGKSTFEDLILNTFGDYGAIGHPGIITTKREDPEAPNVALMSLMGKRHVSFQEIANREINMSVIKSLTGNDKLTGRQMYSRVQVTFKPQFHLTVCANSLPPMSEDDGGSRRRLRNVPFMAKFVENPDDERWVGMSNVFKIDLNLKSRLSQYKLAFMHILLEQYIKYIRDGLPRSNLVYEHTQKYFDNNDVMLTWVEENLTQTEEGKLGTDYKNYIRKDTVLIRMSASPDLNRKYKGNKKALLDALQDKIGMLTARKTIAGKLYINIWFGWQFKTSEEQGAL